MSQTYILRGEDKKFEHRRALVPKDCEKLINAGHKVLVEDWVESIIPTQEYVDGGCEIVAKNTWYEAPKDHIIVGLKYLPNHLSQYKHTHIYFAHAYKGQDDAPNILNKFKSGGGRILDLEFMVDENNRRVCAFGYWAGYMGAALALLRASAKDKAQSFSKIERKEYFSSKENLHHFIKQSCSNTSRLSGIVIGAKGRSGTGAVDLLKSFHVKTTEWDYQETRRGGPFSEILDHDIFVNCVLSMHKIPPFLTHEILGGKLKAISDVSCDPDSDCNVLPLYTKATTLKEPTIQLTKQLELIAIDNLPSLLPRESSEDFSNQLVPYLLDPFASDNTPVSRSLELYHKIVG